MSSFRFLHAADIHLDSPLRGLSRYEGLPEAEIRGSTRRALDRMVETALTEKVDFVVLAGDLYDGTWQDVGTGLYMVRALSRLVQVGIRVVTLSGNHDAQSVIARELPLPDGIDHFSYDAPQTLHWPELGVALHGQSFRDRHVTQDMTRAYPAPVAGCFNIGVLHTSLSGYGEHETYAPCSVETLSAKGYDYWALGHVHAREIVCEHPWIVFPGVLQGRHARETGACGCELVTVEDGIVRSVEFVECDVVRWARLELDVSGMQTMDAVLGAARQAMENALSDAGGRTVIARIVLTGRSVLHDRLCASQAWKEDLRGIAVSMAQGTAQIALEKIRNETSAPAHRAGVAETRELDLALEGLMQDEDFLASLPEAFEGFFSALPSCVERDSLMPDGRFPLEEARAALRARLVGETE
ncbi:metallophosphoesterase family protein [Gluconobacter oxydans]|uniref:DNA repair exonuclease n=2 Tax=Gluconobacter oxydans TaxID=442 RepID=A0AB35AL42_GLUOY|nr:DNA repair exonuclease [Gluconobacter oxydans]AAW60790.1 Putative exonuclease [Gluconobacter oxydans 621H]KXV12856.1 metallophosphoesterase [Gluconobacter oxydans]KXV30826.1 metallophosphoesterase [Gluconobacter oxydans]MBF0855578.1 DNA repair exonuclease [Gluconobacter oxydans]TCW24765.1 DNA repair exonuclease SbcCD nuclease subunit [Gluconobacter oxydans]